MSLSLHKGASALAYPAVDPEEECTRPGTGRAARGLFSRTAKSGAPAVGVCQKQSYCLKKHFAAVVPYL